MKRWVLFTLCLIGALAAFLVSWLMPIHLRAVDAQVLQQAGRGTSGLIDRGLTLVADKKYGAATLLLQAAQLEKIPGYEKLSAAITNAARANPAVSVLGMEPGLKPLLEFEKKTSGAAPLAASLHKTQPITDLLIRSENRENALQFLRGSRSPVVQELLRCRTLTNTVLFSPSQSSSGQAFDAALALCGLMVEGQKLAPGFVNAISAAGTAAFRGGDSQPIEQILIDVMSLGQRFNYGQLVSFIEKIDDPETLRLQANLVRRADAQLPTLFSAVQLSGKPAAAAGFLMKFGQTGPKDLTASLHFGAGGVNELLQRSQRLYVSHFPGNLNALSGALVYLPLRMPQIAWGLKCFLYLLAGFLSALAMHFARPPVPIPERAFQVRGFHVAREILFGMGFLLVVLLLSEPFLALESQNVEFPIRLQLPMVSSAISAENVGANRSIMNQLSLLTLLLFFVLQALIYVACLVKLAEIRRQTFPAQMKLKLLENEEHLFDAGLYLGFAGTIISLILVSMGIIKPSLMAAYSSTSFGVIFVSVFKIFHLRPLRRKLLLEAEVEKNLSTSPSTEHRLAAPL